MTEEFFNKQIERLRTRFGEKAFDAEFTRLVAKEVSHMTHEDFFELVSFFIGTRPPHKSPMITDFKEQRLLIEKRKFNREVEGATRIFRDPNLKPLKDLLAKDFGAVDSITEALEIAKIRHKAKEGE